MPTGHRAEVADKSRERTIHTHTDETSRADSRRANVPCRFTQHTVVQVGSSSVRAAGRGASSCMSIKRRIPRWIRPVDKELLQNNARDMESQVDLDRQLIRYNFWLARELPSLGMACQSVPTCNRAQIMQDMHVEYDCLVSMFDLR